MEWLTTLLENVLVPLLTAVAGAAGGAVFMRRKYNVDVFSGLIAGVKEAQAFLRAELVLYREEITMLREALKKAEDIGSKAVEKAKELLADAEEARAEAMRWREEESNRRQELAACQERVHQMQVAFQRKAPSGELRPR